MSLKTLTGVLILLSTLAFTTSATPILDTSDAILPIRATYPTHQYGPMPTPTLSNSSSSNLQQSNDTDSLEKRDNPMMQINYYNNNICTSYIGNLQYNWAAKQGQWDAGCYNFQWGKSANIATCEAPGGHCMCEFYQQADCGGDGYSTARRAPGGAYNCRRNSDKYKSMKCFYY